MPTGFLRGNGLIHRFRLSGNPAADVAFVILVFPGELEELGWVDIVLFEEPAVPTAAVHEIVGHLTPQFGPSFWDYTGKPFDTLHFSFFRR